MTRVLANAISDQLGWCRWKITVTGIAPFALTRSYDIRAKTEDEAAREGLNRFVDEMEEIKERES